MRVQLPAFDDLLDMARNDPQQLEALRNRLTRIIINDATSEQQRRRLTGLQFQIDMESRRARSPLAATIRLSLLMTQSLAELHRSLVAPIHQITCPRAEHSADILAFPGTALESHPQD